MIPVPVLVSVLVPVLVLLLVPVSVLLLVPVQPGCVFTDIAFDYYI